jgi:uncharacterized protein YndB with AHSA1/START domain
MLDRIRLQREYSYAPQDVWIAITDPHALAEWLMPNDFQPVVGHKFTFQVDPMPGCVTETRCEVLEVDAPRRLVYTWLPVAKNGSVPASPSRVAWTLSPIPGGTRLVLEHTGLEGVFPWWQRLMLRFGWGTIVKRWIPKASGRVQNGRFVPGLVPLEKRCYKARTIPPHLIR